MKPNIYDIVRNSLKIAKNIIFYLPRNMLIVELFEIIKILGTTSRDQILAMNPDYKEYRFP